MELSKNEQRRAKEVVKVIDPAVREALQPLDDLLAQPTQADAQEGKCTQCPCCCDCPKGAPYCEFQ